MKEARYFYVPDAATSDQLPEEEAQHALRVLRLQAGDEMFLMDGNGTFFRAEVTKADRHRCLYAIRETMPQQPLWQGRIHLAIAPTKMMERMEWMAEKATEVGVSAITFLRCAFSERTVVKTARVDKIVVAAMKQSRKPWKPEVEELTPFDQFVKQKREGLCCIAHCYDDLPREDFFDLLGEEEGDVTVLVGPEGDFSHQEVEEAIARGYRSISLGQARLRTETAGLMAVTMAQLRRRI